MLDQPSHILFVDDEERLRTSVAERLTQEGFVVQQAASGEAALGHLQRVAFDLLITDLRLPGVAGGDVIDAALERYPGILAIVMTRGDTVKDALDVIRRGAADLVAKPFHLDELLHVVDRVRQQRRLTDENAYLRQQLAERDGLGAMVGKSAPMQALYQRIDMVAGTHAPVLITGETGTGKEMVARAIHQGSPRRQQRFVALDCGAIPEALLEAELFGHVKSAFTGTGGTRPGRIEQAHRGTLFLDEVGALTAAVQLKLLRVLQDREFERIGDPRTVKIDVRVLAASSADLSPTVREGSFRGNLFRRPDVLTIQLPPLRDRREDIPPLVTRFLERLHPSGGEPIAVSENAMRGLMRYHWPGNVRQLETVIERAVALRGGRRAIQVEDLPDDMRPEPEQPRVTPQLSKDGIDLPLAVADLERQFIDQALALTGGNRGAAARLLGLKRTTLVEKLRRLAPRQPLTDVG